MKKHLSTFGINVIKGFFWGAICTVVFFVGLIILDVFMGFHYLYTSASLVGHIMDYVGTLEYLK